MKKALLLWFFVLVLTNQNVFAQDKQSINVNNQAAVYSKLQNISIDHSLKLDLQEQNSREETAFILVNLLGQIKQNAINLSAEEKVYLQELEKEYSSEIEKIEGKVVEFEGEEPFMKGFVDKVKYYHSPEFKGKITNKHFNFAVATQLRWSTDINHGANKYPERFNEQLFGVVVKGEIVEDFNYYINALFLKNFAKHPGGAIGDWYFSSTHIPHHKIKIGQFRAHYGKEGTMSDFTMDCIDRSQTARKIGNKRDNGIQIEGNYEYVDYLAGTYLGVGNEFRHAMNKNLDYNAWLYLKPFGSDSKYGKLKIGSGMYTGSAKSVNYHSLGSSVEYGYKNYNLLTEYLYRDGYGTANNTAHGVMVTNKYRITPKTELVARCDIFDSNKGTSNTNTSEYTLGVNYFQNGWKLKHSLNYVYVVDDVQEDSARITFHTQYIF